jgi:transposase
VEVKLLEQDNDLYILAKSTGRVHKERGMRQRKLKRLWKRLHELQNQKLSRDQLLIKLGGAKKDAGSAYSLVDIQLPNNTEELQAHGFTFQLNKNKLRKVRRREGRYLLRSNLTHSDPAALWEYYIQLTEIEQAFKDLKSDLSIRPIYHQLDHRIEAHIFVAFVAYCLQVTLKQRSRALAPGLTPRAVLEKFAAVQMVDVHLPTTDGRHLLLSRYTQPEKDLQLLLKQLQLTLPEQPPPKIQSRAQVTA